MPFYGPYPHKVSDMGLSLFSNNYDAHKAFSHVLEDSLAQLNDEMGTDYNTECYGFWYDAAQEVMASIDQWSAEQLGELPLYASQFEDDFDMVDAINAAFSTLGWKMPLESYPEFTPDFMVPNMIEEGIWDPDN